MNSENPNSENLNTESSENQTAPGRSALYNYNDAVRSGFLKLFKGSKDPNKVFVAIIAFFAVICSLCLILKQILPEKASLVVDAADMSSLERYRSGSHLDLSGSTCYPEIEEFISSHPDLHVRYTVDLGGYSADSDVKTIKLAPDEYSWPLLSENLHYLKELRQLEMPQTSLSGYELAELRGMYPDIEIAFTYDVGGKIIASDESSLSLKAGEYSFEKLLGFLKAADVQKLILKKTDLRSDQLSAISKELPEDGFTYSVMYSGREYSNTDNKIDLSHSSDRETDDLEELLRCLPSVEYVVLNDLEGEVTLSLESILRLYSANPNAEYQCVFEMFGKKISTADREIIYKNANIGNEGSETVRKVLPILVKCERLVLDDCGIDNEVMAGLRDSFPDKKIVWRVHWQNRYSALTDVTIIRAGSYVKCSNDGGIQDLKYCTDVVFADLGHNRHLTDVSFLAYWKHIRVLLLDDAMMPSLDVLSGATELQLLEIVKCFALTSFEPLANCKNLRFINFSNCYDITDLSPLYGLDKLERVYSMGMHKTKLADKNQRYEIQEKLPNCKFYFTAPPESEIGGLYSVGWKLDSAPNEYSAWYKEVSKIFRYRTRDRGEGIFNYEEEPDSIFYFDESELEVFTKDRSM